MEPQTDEPEIPLNPARLSRKQVCTGLLDLFSKGRKQASAAGLAVARSALMDAAKLHGLTEKQRNDGEAQAWNAFLERLANALPEGEGGEAAQD